MNPIRKRRIEACLTARQTAKALGVSVGHVYAIERGDAALTLRLARKLGASLDVPVETLLLGRPGQPHGAGRGRRRNSRQIGTSSTRATHHARTGRDR
ncbi:MAG: helix-turn-helix domain-containing protein [Armatimonadetes bacterium]|nr:helix-turn-helix domain-containing protein [Armatimonadota bacterium]